MVARVSFAQFDPLVVLAIVAGFTVRTIQLLRTDFPINDGGLFYMMVEALKANGLRPPRAVAWAQYDIPFAYPPLGFYSTAIVGLVTGLDTVELMRILPLLGSMFAVIAFAFLARILLSNRIGEVVAVSVFAMIPLGYMWSISGGGITRAPAQGFGFLALGFVVLQLRAPSSQRLIAATVCCALTVLFHPEFAQLLAFSCVLCALMYGRSREDLASVACIGLGTLLLATPWWLSVALRDGFGVFLLPGSGGTPLAAVRSFDLDDLRLASLARSSVHALSFGPALILALAWSMYRRELGLALLVVACLVTRNPVFYGWPGFALILGGLSAALQTHGSTSLQRAAASIPAIVAVVSGAALVFAPLPMVPRGELEAMAWIRDNTATSATFLVFPRPDWYSLDPPGDWFAALTSRTGYGPPMGTEWVGKFEEGESAYVRLSACRNTACVEQWAESQQLEFDYIYVPRTAPLEVDYELVYGTSAARVFRTSRTGPTVTLLSTTSTRAATPRVGRRQVRPQRGATIIHEHDVTQQHARSPSLSSGNAAIANAEPSPS